MSCAAQAEANLDSGNSRGLQNSPTISAYVRKPMARPRNHLRQEQALSETIYGAVMTGPDASATPAGAALAIRNTLAQGRQANKPGTAAAGAP